MIPAVAMGGRALLVRRRGVSVGPVAEDSVRLTASGPVDNPEPESAAHRAPRHLTATAHAAAGDEAMEPAGAEGRVPEPV